MNDGGPAYPSTSACESWQCRKPSSGMSLRDYFAGQALATFIIGTEVYGAGSERVKNVTAACYVYADAMLLARSK